MIQLTYQPSYDPFHTVFRFLRLRPRLSEDKIVFDALRLLDFYLLYPFKVAEIRLRPEHRKFRQLSTKYADRRGYAQQPSDVVLLERMSSAQEAAAQTLAEANVIDKDLLPTGVVMFLRHSTSSSLSRLIEEANEREADLMDLLQTLAGYPLLGRDGLKARTGLLEHRYDAV